MSTVSQIYEKRSIVARWLKIKADQPSERQDFQTLLGIVSDERSDYEERLRRLLRQLNADALHSSLLWRLFDGEEPRGD
jgi:hypothetical protein